MIARIAVWSVADALVDLGELRERMREEWLPALAAAPGLALGAFLSDELGDRWGLLTVWELEPGLLPGYDTIGKEPEIDDELAVEAVTVGAGHYGDRRLGGRGRATGGSELLRLSLWRLGGDARASLAELRLHVEEDAVYAHEDVPGLRWQAWLSDEAGGTSRFAAISLWERPDAALAPSPERSADLIGRGPDIVEEFDVEATVAGLEE